VAAAMGAMGGGKLDRTVVVGTDVAGYFLFHPEDLAHRRTSPLGWTSDDFACGAEFAAGNLVAIDTGGDGATSIRVTDGDLKPREKARATGWWAFRYRVRHGRVLIDGGAAVPSDEVGDERSPEDHWFTIPDGNYQVTVYAIDRTIPSEGDERPGFDKSLPSYVFQFRPVQRLDSIKVLSRTPPRLEPGSRAEPRNEPPSWASLLDDTSKPLERSYPALVRAGSTLTPGTSEHFDVPEAVYDAISGAGEVVLVADKVPGVGILAREAGGGRRADGTWHVGVHGVRLVKVTAMSKGEPLQRASVAPLVRSAAKLAPGDMKALKAAFEKYAKADAAFRKTEPNPDYQAERVAAIESPAALTNLLLHLVRLPPEERAKLLPLTDAARIRGLRAFLESAHGPADGGWSGTGSGVRVRQRLSERVEAIPRRKPVEPGSHPEGRPPLVPRR
jgi:hypothetical protein